jgi:hypothetical protein
VHGRLAIRRLIANRRQQLRELILSVDDYTFIFRGIVTGYTLPCMVGDTVEFSTSANLASCSNSSMYYYRRRMLFSSSALDCPTYNTYRILHKSALLRFSIVNCPIACQSAFPTDPQPTSIKTLTTGRRAIITLSSFILSRVAGRADRPPASLRPSVAETAPLILAGLLACCDDSAMAAGDGGRKECYR